MSKRRGTCEECDWVGSWHVGVRAEDHAAGDEEGHREAEHGGTATVVKRGEVKRHDVTVELEVSEMPVIADKQSLRTRYPIQPGTVILTYSYSWREKAWWTRARVYGAPVNAPTLMNGWADFAHQMPQSWPGWLRKLADDHMPKETW